MNQYIVTLVKKCGLQLEYKPKLMGGGWPDHLDLYRVSRGGRVLTQWRQTDWTLGFLEGYHRAMLDENARGLRQREEMTAVREET